MSQSDDLKIIRPGVEQAARGWLEKTETAKPVPAIFAISLSQTQDDWGKTPWTLYGGADPETEFWKNFPAGRGFSEWLCPFLARADIACEQVRVFGKIKIFSTEDSPKVLFTFEPRERWKLKWREAYDGGKLVVIPHPSTLEPFQSKLAEALPFSEQIALGEIFSRTPVDSGLRVLKVADLPRKEAGPITVLRQIFDPAPEVIELVGRPLARNVQIWGSAGPSLGQWFMDGSSKDFRAIARARKTIEEAPEGSAFRYREYFPPLEIEGNQVEWRRPVAGWYFPATRKFETPWEWPGRVLLSKRRKQVELRVAMGELEENADETKQRALTPKTWDLTVNEAFEHSYWDKLVELTEGEYRHKNNVDCPPATLSGGCAANDLPRLIENYFLPYYRSLDLAAHRHVFPWLSAFEWTWWGGRKLPQNNLIVVVPGLRHDEAVVMADHFDTAYMKDIFKNEGLRQAARGADDNASATAALLEAARVLKAKRLKRDVWLVHLTGEEFPADCLGARAFADALVTGKRLIAGKENPKIVGLYVLDMIGHSVDRDGAAEAPSVFQIATGQGARAVRLGQIAADVTRAWNASVGTWNETSGRKQKARRIRFGEGGVAIPRPPTFFLPVFQGEVRPHRHPKSALYNTDGIIFSDSGIPAVLLMENYDRLRRGYHDTEDTLENLDLDYAAGMARIAIEAVAQAADE